MEIKCDGCGRIMEYLGQEEGDRDVAVFYCGRCKNYELVVAKGVI